MKRTRLTKTLEEIEQNVEDSIHNLLDQTNISDLKEPLKRAFKIVDSGGPDSIGALNIHSDHEDLKQNEKCIKYL